MAVEVGELLEDGVVALGLDDDGGELVVLRRRADHRRAADVDVLDDVGVRRAAARRRLLERVEVHAHEVDELDRVLLGGDHVRRVVTAGEQAGVELRVQRLDPPVHDLGKPVKSSIARTVRPAAASACAVPPVETSSMSSAARPLANSTMPVLSDTESTARRMRTSPGCVTGRTIVRTRSARAAGWRGRSGPRRGRSAGPPRRAARARRGAAPSAPPRARSPPAGRARAAG